MSSYGVSVKILASLSNHFHSIIITYRVHASVEPNCLNAELQAESEEVS